MRKKLLSKTGLISPRACLVFTLCSLGCFLAMLSFASEPSSGKLTDATPALTYTAGPFLQANPSPLGLGQLDTGPRCGVDFPCDNYELTVELPAGYVAAHPNASVRVALSWTDTGSGNSDYDLYVYQGVVGDLDGTQPAPYQGGGQDNPEVANIYPIADGEAVFSIKVVPFTPTGEIVTVRIELLSGSGDGNAFPNFGGPDPTVPGVPRYQTFYPPAGSSAEAGSGEFNIGFNPATGRIMADNIGPVWRLTPPEIEAPTKPALPECCPALWEDKSSTVADTGVDPILWTDQKTGRTFASNATTGANALYGYTDNDGDLWHGLLGVAPPNGGDDHQTIASGPYPASLAALLTTPVNQGQAVYYCSQTFPVGAAACQRSDTLGTSYGPGILAYDGSPGCRALHGHLKVAPDGTLYIPVPDCSVGALSQNGFARSTDGGVTWVERYIPNSEGTSRGSDSSIAVDAAGKLYYFYILEAANGNEGHMYAQVSSDQGDTWTNPVNLGATHGIVNVAFPESAAGDSGRAVVGFLGTDQPGNFQSLAFPGLWYSFVSTTFDGGTTWTTINVSPNDPVQGLGGIWQGGGSNDNRNLLDFNELTIDDKGRPIYGYSDGCVGDCVANPTVNSFTAHMRVARQSGGRTMLASQDALVDTPNNPILPKPACLSGKRDPRASHLKWEAPDNGGADIINYQIFRGTAAGTGVLIGQTANAKTVYDDTTADPAVEEYFYTVKAVNSVGVGPHSNEISLTAIAPPPCVDPTGPFLDDFEPEANPDWLVDTAVNQVGPASPPWQVATDADAQSASHSFTSDATTLAAKDDRLIAPPQNVSATTVMTFWHRYGFEDGYDGGVLEVSTDFGATWVDVQAGGGSFISGGYNGTIDPGLGSAIAGRAAWTGGDGSAPMTKVEVNLGGVSGINVMVRFRLVADPVAPLSVPGVAWFIDDVEFTNLQDCPPVIPIPTPAQLLNISTRLRVQEGDNVLIGGFIITGTQPKKILLRAMGPSVPVPGQLADPTLELRDLSGGLIASNDDWKDSPERAEIEATGIPPNDDKESAIVRELAPGSYTAIVRGKDNTSGIALVEVYDRDPGAGVLANISTRGFVETGDNVMIGGFIAGNQTAGTDVLVRAIGPSIGNQVPNALADPVLELRDANGGLIAANDNWKDDQQTEIEATGIPPSNDLESAIFRTLAPAAYTGIVRGKDGTTGVALVEIYNIR